MVDEEGQIAVDFLLGISLFLIALIFTVQFIPGMFMAGSVREGSLDYTAYRTATILTEDTGWWGNSTTSGTDWESHTSDIMRLGLAADEDTNSRLTHSPNVLSTNKTIQLMNVNETELIEALGLYNNVDDTHFSYGYNISVTKSGSPLVLNNTSIMLGDPVPDDRETSKITRVVLVEAGSTVLFDSDKLPVFTNHNTRINLTGPWNDNLTFSIINLNYSSNSTQQFDKMTILGPPPSNLKEEEEYSIKKIYPNGTITDVEKNGKIGDTDIVVFDIYNKGLFTGNQTYTLELKFTNNVEYNVTAPIPEFQDFSETYYEPAYLTVEVWY